MFVFLLDMQTNHHYLPTAYIEQVRFVEQQYVISIQEWIFPFMPSTTSLWAVPPLLSLALWNWHTQPEDMQKKKKKHSRLVPSLWGCCAAERAITLSISSHIILPAETHKHSDTNVTESSLAPLKSISCHTNSNISTYEQKLSNLWVGQKCENASCQQLQKTLKRRVKCLLV